MLSGVIKPSNEDKSGNIKCSNNYREVMISTIFFLSCRVHDATIHQIDYKHSSYQFAYRCDSSIPFLPMLFYEKNLTATLTVIAPFTIVSLTTRKKNSRTCHTVSTYGIVEFNLSTAFERVDHEKLLTKLQENPLPPFILNMIKLILFNTRICVNFNGRSLQNGIL